MAGARELLLAAGDTHIYAITSLDGQAIGEGKPGPVYRELKRLLEEDAQTGVDDHEAL